MMLTRLLDRVPSESRRARCELDEESLFLAVLLTLAENPLALALRPSLGVMGKSVAFACKGLAPGNWKKDITGVCFSPFSCFSKAC